MKQKLLAFFLASLPSLTQIAPVLAQQQQQTAALSPDTPVNLPGLYYDPDPGPSPTFQQLTTAEQAGYVEVPPLPNGVQLPYQVDRAWPQGATPDQILKFGDLKQNPVTAGFTKLTLREITAKQGTDIAGVPIDDVPLVGGLTVGQVDELYTKIENGEKITVDDAAPAIQAALGVLHDPSQAGKQLQQAALTTTEKVLVTKLSKIPALKGIPLQDLARGNWEGVISKAEQIELAGIGKKIGPTLKKLPVNQIVPLVGDAINGNWRQVRQRAQAYVLAKGTNVAVKEVIKAVPELKDLPLGAVPDLVNQPIEKVLPKVADLAIEEIPGAEDKVINSVPGLSEIPINKLPFNLAFSFLAGDVFARFDIAYSGVEGPEEPSVQHALSGGTEDQKFRPIKCTLGKTKNQRADNCPHFEMRKFISSPLAQVTGEDDVEGKQWVAGHSKGKNGQGVKGGKGLLKRVNGGWEPSGITPFGPGTKFVLKKIKEYPNKPSTARLYLAIQIKVHVPILGEQATPHFIVFPTPFTVREGGLFLVASRRSLPAEIAKFRDRALTAAGLNQVYCDPNQLIATAGQSDTEASDIKQEDISDLQAKAKAEGVDLQPIEGSTGAPRLDGIPGQPGAASRPGQSADNRSTSASSNGGIQPIDGSTNAPKLTGIPGQPGAVSRQGSTASTPADPEHNLRQYLARIRIGESTDGTNWKPSSQTGAYGIYQFTPESRQSLLQRTGIDGWTRDRAVAAQAAVEWIKIIGAEENVDLMAAIRRGDFALADKVLSPWQWTSLPGGPEESEVWKNPANFEKYGPTGDASTNEPVGVASRGLPCRPGNGPGQGNIDNSNFVQGSGVASGRLSDPLAKYDYKLTSNYGPRTRPRVGFHYGIDLAHYEGTPFVAADGGVVVESRWNGDYGNWILIDHGNGLATWYGHNKVNYVKAGDTVNPGQPIGEVGSTGFSTGPHIDLGVIEGYVTGDRNSGTVVNPRKHINLPPQGSFNQPQ